MKYKICPVCGAHLDPGERCDCESEKREVETCRKEEKKKPGAAACESFK